MTATPLVSFVIPCHNHGRYLDEAVDSVFAQTTQDFDIVIVNDGSIDADTNRLLATYTRPRTRVIRTEHRGLPAARNTGIAATTAPFLCMLDADDRLEPQYLERSLAAFDADPELGFVSHWLRTFGDESWEWTPTDCSLSALLKMNTVNGAALVRRPVVEAVGGFDESMRDGCEDWDFWISVLEQGYRGRILNEFLFWYRRRAESMSRTMLADDGQTRLYGRLIAKHTDTFRKHLPVLLAAREREWTDLRRNAEELEFGLHDWTIPEVRRLRDEVAARLRGGSRMEFGDELHALREAVGRLEAERDAATKAALASHVEASRASQLLDEIRRSASWRVTGPLRALWDIALRLRGEGSQ